MKNTTTHAKRVAHVNYHLKNSWRFVYHVENILLSRTLLHQGPTIHLDYMRLIYNH